MEVVTLKVTRTFIPEVPDVLRWTMPVYVPAVNPVWFTETVTVPGVLKRVGLAESQEPPEVETVTKVRPIESETDRVCGGGTEAGGSLKVNDVGLAVSPPELDGTVTVNETIVV